MASSAAPPPPPPLHLQLLVLVLFFLPYSTFATTQPHKLRLFSSADLPTPTTPTTYFEVDRPLHPPPGSSPGCSTTLLSHTFAYTYGKPPVTNAYTPPPCLLTAGGPPAISLAVLEWASTSRGRQFDRIFGVWLSGVELLRSCSAEPRRTGIVWSVAKDITKYSSLLAGNGTLAVYLGNIVDSTYTGVYPANITLHLYFYPSSGAHFPPLRADLIVPISRSLPLNDGQWFPINNATDVQSVPVSIPKNAYRAVLQVYISFHQNDEFWYTNPPDEYIQSNNLTGTPGNGPFREVRVIVDGDTVGAVWPFTVVYTGGINPLLWRPITGIGSFDLPTYEIEITPFLGKLLDGEEHEFGFGVTNALDVWYVDANLLLWLDPKSSRTTGGLIDYKAPALATNLVSQFRGLNGTFKTSANRHISATGWVKSSFGTLTTQFYQKFDYVNTNVYQDDGAVQVVNQTINAESGVYAKSASTVLHWGLVRQNFPLYVYTGTADQVNDTYTSVADVKLGFNEKTLSGGFSGSSFSLLKNMQSGHGEMKVKKNLVLSGIGSTHQVYRYEGTDGCYLRNVSSKNYTILFDRSSEHCMKKSSFGAAQL